MAHARVPLLRAESGRTVKINQGQADWSLNFEGVFKDADAGDRVDQIAPADLPAWLTYTPSATDTGGVLSGTPGNGDVGVKTLQWQALDDAGSTATYRLRLDVQNVNDAPERRNNPNLSELGEIINGVPAVDQDAYGRLDLNELFRSHSFYGDALRYSITEIRKDAQHLRPSYWIGLTIAASAPDATDKFFCNPCSTGSIPSGRLVISWPRRDQPAQAGTTLRVHGSQ